ncbi:fragment of resolvase protein, partial [Aromatoleum aromaticum EbN1]
KGELHPAGLKLLSR